MTHDANPAADGTALDAICASLEPKLWASEPLVAIMAASPYKVEHARKLHRQGVARVAAALSRLAERPAATLAAEPMTARDHLYRADELLHDNADQHMLWAHSLVHQAAAHLSDVAQIRDEAAAEALACGGYVFGPLRLASPTPEPVAWRARDEAWETWHLYADVQDALGDGWCSIEPLYAVSAPPAAALPAPDAGLVDAVRPLIAEIVSYADWHGAAGQMENLAQMEEADRRRDAACAALLSALDAALSLHPALQPDHAAPPERQAGAPEVSAELCRLSAAATPGLWSGGGSSGILCALVEGDAGLRGIAKFDQKYINWHVDLCLARSAVNDLRARIAAEDAARTEGGAS